MNDLYYILIWWVYLFAIGLIFLPFTSLLFNRFFDKGYIFSKTIGIVLLSYLTFILGVLHIVPFERVSLIVFLIILALFSLFIFRKTKSNFTKKDFIVFVFQEVLFFVALLFWSYIKSFQPDIFGLEKYMDYGFMNSILRSNFFPPVDMWFPPFSINYYYFGHLTTAVLIKLTGVPGFIAYNLMLATIFAMTVTSAFSIVSTLSHQVLKIKRASFLSGILAGIITALGGNLHTIYTFFAPYSPPENPVPFWNLKLLIESFPNSYWYPNATRFIPYTIHEFPSYSFVVSDLHGHVLDIPFVFLTLALILAAFLQKKLSFFLSICISFMLAVMYMTNAWDGIIYFGLFIISVLLIKSSLLKFLNPTKKIRKYNLFKRIVNKKVYLWEVGKMVFLVGVGYIIFSLPFNLHFKPFVSGIGVLCAPEFLTNIEKLGPFIFESDHCQRTPFWMLIILYGFFYFFAIALAIKILKLTKTPMSLIYILLLILLSTLLIAAPEFIYAKDIYPAHYRANTMFKLGYQAFIMLSLVSAFSITYLLHKGKRILWILITFILLTLILMYPYFAISSYFNNLKSQKSLDGISYLKSTHPEDYEAILWIQKNISDQPILVEAQGDSYTDYGRISANTGLPTILGWTVHEWLWRGDYSYPQSRLEDVRLIYEGTIDQTKTIIKRYSISYIYVGTLERTKYPNIQEEKFQNLGKAVFNKNTTTIYKVN